MSYTDFAHKRRTMGLLGAEFEIDSVDSAVDLFHFRSICSSSVYTERMLEEISIKLTKFVSFSSIEIRMDYLKTLSNNRSVSFLGGCYQCEYCKCVLAPGVYNCYRCGGNQREYIRNSKYYNLGYVTQVDLDPCLIDSDGTFLRITISTRKNTSYALRERRTEILSTIHSEGWLCRYCHSIVEARYSDCPYCGGGQKPFSDIMKMSSKCLYCSSETENGVCKGCNSRRGAAPIWPNHYVL